MRRSRAGGPRRVGIAALYDAVAAVREDGSIEAVHSCGHALIAGAAVGAALALAPLRGQLAGELVVIGCPADEIHSAAAGRGFEPDPPPLPFATDFGSISHRVPAALIGVGRPEGWHFHTDEGAAQFASTAGVDVAVDIATVLALATVRLSEPTPA